MHMCAAKYVGFEVMNIPTYVKATVEAILFRKVDIHKRLIRVKLT